MGELEFQFADKEDPIEYVVKLASKMQLFESDEKAKDLLKHMHVVEELDKELVSQISKQLADPANMVVVMRSKTFEAQCTLEDPYFLTKY